MVQVAKEFSVNKSYENSVISSMCYGIQWDAVMQFFDNKYIDGTPVKESYVVENSTDKDWLSGNYKKGNPQQLTGIDNGSPAGNRVKNIYDMGGNVIEMTMEIIDNNNGYSIVPVFRGSGLQSWNVSTSPSFRYYSGNNLVNREGVRITLSLKE